MSVDGVDGHDACEFGGDAGGVSKLALAFSGARCGPAIVREVVRCIVQSGFKVPIILKDRRIHCLWWVAHRLDRQVDCVGQIGDGSAIRRYGCRG